MEWLQKIIIFFAFAARKFGRFDLRSLLHEVLVFLEGDVLVEIGGALGALGDEMEADATDVLLGAEVLEVADLLALDLEFEQPEVRQAHLVALTEMEAHHPGHIHHQSFEHTSTDAGAPRRLFEELTGLDGLVMHCNCLVLAERRKGRLRLFLDPVSHKSMVFAANIQIF